MHISNTIIHHQCWLTKLEKFLYPVKLMATFITAAIAVTVMLGWLSPDFSAMLPSGWHQMQSTTALTVLLLSYSLGLKVAKTKINTKAIQGIFLTFALIIISTTFYEHLNNHTAILGKYLIASEQRENLHPSSIQTATSLLLITALLSINERSKGLMGYVMCTLLSLLVLLMMVFMSSYLFGADALVSSNSHILISKQTLLCISLLTSVIYTIRGPYSVFSVLFSTSLGGQFARRFLTITMTTLLLVMSLQALFLVEHSFSIPEIIAVSETANIAILFFIIIIAANKIEKQSHELEQMGLTDKLTATYNLRGLHLHAEKKLLDARRNNAPLSVLMFDLDGLKEVNDVLGHEIGSNLIKSFATALNNNYRSNDIVARAGGDEFVVVTMETEKEAHLTLDRFAETIREINQFAKQPYQISYSVGMEQLHPDSRETIESLMKLADQKMYAAKNEKKAELRQTKANEMAY